MPDNRDLDLPPRRRARQAILLTGDKIDGRPAAASGLVMNHIPAAELDAYVEALADHIRRLPADQLAMQGSWSTRRSTTWA